MTWTPDQRAMAAAILCDLAGIALRGGDMKRATAILSYIGDGVLVAPVTDYRAGLIAAGLLLGDIDASVAAIGEGLHPSDSIPGCVAAYRDKVEKESTEQDNDERRVYCDGEAKAARWFLELLGCEGIRT